MYQGPQKSFDYPGASVRLCSYYWHQLYKFFSFHPSLHLVWYCSHFSYCLFDLTLTFTSMAFKDSILQFTIGIYPEAQPNFDPTDLLYNRPTRGFIILFLLINFTFYIFSILYLCILDCVWIIICIHACNNNKNRGHEFESVKVGHMRGFGGGKGKGKIM